jgi:hypothetical protein
LHLIVEDLILGRAVEAGIGISLGVDVLKDRTERFTDGSGSLAFGRDQDQLTPLPLGLVGDEAGDGGVQGFERSLKEPPMMREIILDSVRRVGFKADRATGCSQWHLQLPASPTRYCPQVERALVYIVSATP